MERALTRVVSIVVVTWNSAPYLPRCLAGIQGQTHHPLELIAIDNASSDDSALLCERAGFRVVRNDKNRGFSAAMNQGFAIATGEFVLAVNPDCYLEPRYIETVIAAMGEDVGTASGVLRRAEGYEIRPIDGIDSAGMRMTRNGRHLDICHPPSAISDVFGVSGAAALYRRTLLEDVKIDGEILDEDFFAYREDADLAWRARLFGWRSIVVPDAIGYHVRRVTPDARRALPANLNMHSVKNRFLLRSKNQGWYLAIRNAPFELARDLVVILAALTIERSSLPAFGWLWRNRVRIRAKRRAIQARRKVSDRALARWFR